MAGKKIAPAVAGLGRCTLNSARRPVILWNCTERRTHNVGATRRPWTDGRTRVAAPNRGVSCLSRAVERGIVSDLRRSPRRKRAHRPGQRPQACKSVRNKYPKLLGGVVGLHQLLVSALTPTLASHAVRAQAVALLSSLPRETSACVSSGSVRRRLSLSSSLQLCTASLSLAHV